MNQLTVTQQYALCALHKEGKQATYPNSTYTGCIIMAAFLELFLLDSISFDEKKNVLLKTPTNINSDYLFLIWRELADSKPMTLKQWMEYYLYNFSVKKIRRIVNAVMDSLVSKHALIPEVKKGLFHDKVTYRTDSEQMHFLVDSMKAELFRARMISEKTIALVVLLRESGLLKHYFSREEERELHKIFREMEHSDIGTKAAVVKQVLDEMDTMMAMTVVTNTFFNT